MLKFLFLILYSFLFISNCFSEPDIQKGRIEITEEDLSPSTFPYQIKVINGSLADNGDGTASLSYLSSANISDTAYDTTSWDSVTTIAPSKNAIRDKFESLTGVYARATFTVAAYNSTWKAHADYVCDGTNDEVQIEAALNALPSPGGTIQLLEGDLGTDGDNYKTDFWTVEFYQAA